MKGGVEHSVVSALLPQWRYTHQDVVCSMENKEGGLGRWGLEGVEQRFT